MIYVTVKVLGRVITYTIPKLFGSLWLRYLYFFLFFFLKFGFHLDKNTEFHKYMLVNPYIQMTKKSMRFCSIYIYILSGLKWHFSKILIIFCGENNFKLPCVEFSHYWCLKIALFWVFHWELDHIWVTHTLKEKCFYFLFFIFYSL